MGEKSFKFLPRGLRETKRGFDLNLDHTFVSLVFGSAVCKFASLFLLWVGPMERVRAS